MYFYKDSGTGLFQVDNDILPAGKYLLRIYNNSTDVSIETATAFKVMMYPTKITSLQRADDSYYTDITDLLNSIKDFFKDGSSGTGDLTDVENRLTVLEDTILRITYYEEITTSSGSVALPTGATIVFDHWAYGIDALVSEIVGGKPNFESGGIIVNSFNSNGDYVLSGPVPTNPAALIYVYDISFLDYGSIDRDYIVTEGESSGGGTGGTGIPVYINLIKLTQSEGDLHFADITDWNVSKAAIKNIKVVTNATDWDLYILQNGNGYTVNDAAIPAKTLMMAGNLTEEISMDYAYEDEDDSLTLHLYWIDNSGTNNVDFYISGFEME